MAMYCGDEVCAVVADLGHSSCRFGQAGQDSPRHVFRSDLGVVAGSEDSVAGGQYVAGDSALRVLRGGMEVVQPFSNGEVDWDGAEALLRHGLDSCLRHVDPRDYPLLLAQNPAFHSDENKEKLLELLFESFDLPATYMCHNATLASFASGRPTSMVVDMGADATRCTPVLDGYALQRSSMATRRGGFYLDQVFAEALHMDFDSVTAGAVASSRKKRCRSDSSGSRRVLTPWYECGGTITTEASTASSSAAVLSQLTPSFRRMHCQDTLRDVRHWMCFVPLQPQTQTPTPTSGSKKKGSSSTSTNSGSSGDSSSTDVSGVVACIPPYELPDGTLVEPSTSLSLTIDRHLFDPSFASSALRKTSRVVHELFSSSGSGSDSSAGHNTEYDDSVDLAALVMKAVLKTDVDARKEVLGNVLVVGGGALTDGVVARLQSDLARTLPTHIKAKVVSSLCPLERQQAAWLGGSILGICGSFQQLWISREEYQEHGAGLHRQRFVH